MIRAIAFVYLYAVASAVAGQALPTAPMPGANVPWGWIGVILIGLALIALAWAILSHRVTIAQIKSVGAGAHRIADSLEKLIPTKAPEPAAAAAEPAAPVVAGKNGQAGPITIQATGSAAEDLAAFNTAYFS